MSEEMVTMVRGRSYTQVIKSILGQHGFLWSEKGFWTRFPAYSAADRVALESEIRVSGAPADMEVRNIRKEWA
jgi:hypothetical protein